MTIKFGLLLTIAGLLSWIATSQIIREYKDRGAEQNLALRQYYIGDNDEYFGGQLPKDADVRWADIPLENGLYVMGETDWEPDTHKLFIRIDRKSNITASQALFTLFHEECHAFNDVRGIDVSDDEQVSHGPEFQRCMLHLAEAGAFKGVW